MSELLRKCDGCGDLWEVTALTDDYLCAKCLGDIDSYLDRRADEFLNGSGH